MARDDRNALRSALSGAMIAIALAGCQTISTNAGAPVSAMNADNNQLRSQLVVVPSSMPRSASYGPVARCGYQQVSTRPGGTPIERGFDLWIRAVRGRLLITLMEGSRASTALIDSDGTLHDFNLTDDEGRRWTMENYSMASAGGEGGMLINQFMAAFPRYAQGLWNVGDRVAGVYSQDGKLWAEYVYRGLTSYQGTEAAVLDLVVPRGGVDVQVAFNIVDIRTMTPLLYVFDAGYRMHLERGPCP